MQTRWLYSRTTVNGRATFQPHHPASFATITFAPSGVAAHRLAPPSFLGHPTYLPSSSLAVEDAFLSSLLKNTLSRLFPSHYRLFARERATTKLYCSRLVEPNRRWTENGCCSNVCAITSYYYCDYCPRESFSLFSSQWRTLNI